MKNITNQEKGLPIFSLVLYNMEINGMYHPMPHQAGIPDEKESPHTQIGEEVEYERKI